jgi:hypothetical protein
LVIRTVRVLLLSLVKRRESLDFQLAIVAGNREDTSPSKSGEEKVQLPRERSIRREEEEGRQRKPRRSTERESKRREGEERRRCPNKPNSRNT